MGKEKMNVPVFPMESFLRVKQEMEAANRELEKEKNDWARVRNSKTEADRNELDEQFKIAFERLGNIVLRKPLAELEEILPTLAQLVQQGASGGLLGDHELGSYNLAMLVKDIPMVPEKVSLDIVTEMIRLTIIAGANLATQKAYVGNGGAASLDWLSMYLGHGIYQHYLRDRQQYTCCYKIFPWIIGTPVNRLNPFNNFLVCLKACPEVADLQEKIMLGMISYGFQPCSEDDIYQSVSFFSHVAAINIQWLTILLPYEAEQLQPYINAFQQHISVEMAKNLINSFTSNNKNRKYFKTYFSQKPHWLLQFIIASAPELIFDLVKRNEQDMLSPFLKNYKPALFGLRDAKGNTLLHHTVLSRGLMENTIQLLRNAGFSMKEENKDGLTPLALAVKNNRTELVKWLK